MALLGFGKRPRHKKFDYIPRFYDPEKEDLESRLSKYSKKEKDEYSPEAVKSRIRGGFKKPISRSFETDDYKKALRKSNRIVFFAALILILLVLYFLLQYFPKFLQAFD